MSPFYHFWRYKDKPFSACWPLFAVEGSEGGNSSVCLAAAGTNSGRAASWGVVRWHYAVAAHDGAAPVFDDAGVDAWADGEGVDRDVGAGDQGDQGGRALSPFMAERDDKTKCRQIC